MCFNECSSEGPPWALTKLYKIQKTRLCSHFESTSLQRSEHRRYIHIYLNCSRTDEWDQFGCTCFVSNIYSRQSLGEFNIGSPENSSPALGIWTPPRVYPSLPCVTCLTSKTNSAKKKTLIHTYSRYQSRWRPLFVPLFLTVIISFLFLAALYLRQRLPPPLLTPQVSACNFIMAAVCELTGTTHDHWENMFAGMCGDRYAELSY